jgi:hypothetical protein
MTIKDLGTKNSGCEASGRELRSVEDTEEMIDMQCKLIVAQAHLIKDQQAVIDALHAVNLNASRRGGSAEESEKHD